MPATTLLPNGEQVFLDQNGDPLVGGLVYFYQPETDIPKDTWMDPDSNVANSNPVVLNAAGRAIIYGRGVYRQKVTDALGNLIWDQQTAATNSDQLYIGGQSGGTVNAQTLDIDDYDLAEGNLILFTFGLTNTGPMTMNVSSTGPIPVTKNDGSGNQIPLAAGDAVLGAFGAIFYDGTQYQLISKIGASLDSNPLTPIASATTTDIGTTGSLNVQITGTTTITSFGSAASVDRPLYFVEFADSLILTHNGTSLILPGGLNITTQAGDSIFALYLGAGNWQVVQYTRAAIPPGGIATSLPSAYGLTVQNNSGTPDTQIDVTATAALLLNSTNQALFTTVNVTINAAVNGANGLDTGSLNASTAYYIFIISNGTVTAGLLSTSPTTPVMPSGYTYKFRCGATFTTGGSVFFEFIQKGNRFQYINERSMGNGDAGVWSAIGMSTYVPVTAFKVFGNIDNINPVLSGTLLRWSVAVAPNDTYTEDNAPIRSFFQTGTTLGSANALYRDQRYFEFVLESAFLYWYSYATIDAAPVTSQGSIWCLGWVDSVLAA